MSYRNAILCKAMLVVGVLFVLPGGRAHGQSVMLKRKYTPGRSSYIERAAKIHQKITGTPQDMEYDIRRVSGVWETAEAADDGGTKVALTFDRVMQGWDVSGMGSFRFDSDDPDDPEAAPLLKQLLPRMLGMPMTLHVDAEGKFAGFSGTEAIHAKVGEGVVANAFLSAVRGDLTDERAGKTWGSDPLMVYPNKKVKAGDTWEGTTSSQERFGTVVVDYRYKADRIATEQGRRVVQISFTANVSGAADADAAAEGPQAEVSGSLSGTATYDVALGTVVEHVEKGSMEIKIPTPTPPQQDEDAEGKKDGQGEGDAEEPGPRFMQIEVDMEIKITVMTLAQRNKQKAEARKLADARRKAEEEAADAPIEALMEDTTATEVDAAWTQWGGSGRDFKVNTNGLARRWPKEGPKRLWTRPIGDGYSSIVTDGETLYTMYWQPDEAASARADADKGDTKPGGEGGNNAKDTKRVEGDNGGADGDKDDAGKDEAGGEGARQEDPALAARRKGTEVVVALDARTGETVWEHKYATAWEADMTIEFGPCPNSTPLIIGDRLYTIGAMVNLRCLDRKTGKKIWAHDLHEEYDASTMTYGYGVNPVQYKDTVIVPIGGKGHAVLAFNQADGSVVWEKQDFGPAYGAPILVDVDGEAQLVVVREKGISGLDPSSGKLKWTLDFTCKLNVSTPIWCSDNTIFISSAYGPGGARAIKLTREDGKTTAKELWFTPKMKVHHGNAIRIGDVVLGSSGDLGAVFMTALDVKTGELLWKNRRFSKANYVYADGRLIILDEDGNFGLATPGRKGLKVHEKVELCKQNAWTVPTLVGTKLYVRDRRQIMALDLGKDANEL